MPVGFGRDGQIATITIDGESEFNALTPELCLELNARLLELDDDADLRVGILRGAGDKHFSIGGLQQQSSKTGRPDLSLQAHLRDYWYPFTDQTSATAPWTTLFARRTIKPVVAAVHGCCHGAALMVLGLHTDLRIAGQSARFGLPRLGLGSGAAAVSRLAAQIPRATLLWMVETGESLDATSAYDRFLVNEVVADADVDARARHIAECVAGLPPHAVRMEKRALVYLDRTPHEEAVYLSAGLQRLES